MTVQKIKLHRIDYVQCGTIKGQAVQLLPSKGVKQQQKIVIGDQKGALQIVSMRKGEPFVEIKVDLGSPIHCIAILAHPSDSGPDTIAVATAQKVRGLTIKGKVVFAIETNLVEPIQHMWIGGGKEDFIVANSYVYNHYQDGKEVNYYLSTDKINSLGVLPINKVPSLTPLLACQDGTIYSLRDSAVRHRLAVDGTPSAIHLLGNDGGSSGEWIVYGTTTGQIGLVRWSRAGPSVQWRLKLTSNAACVTSVDFYDVVPDDDDSKQLIIGRDDGVVEVYRIKIGEDGASDPPSLIYSQNFGDSVACVKGGVVSATGFSEIVVATQRGWVFGLTSCSVSIIRSDKLPVDGVGAARSDMLNAERKKQLNALKNEIEHLEKKLLDAQTKAQQTSASQAQQQVAPPTEIVAKMDFLPEERAHYISIESQMSINFCMVQCDVDLELVDVERNLAILSKVKNISKESETSGRDGNNKGPSFLATFRCQVNTTRLEMKLRCAERRSSDQVRVYVVPQVQTSARCAILKTFRIVCLCRHSRCPPFDWDDSDCGRLTISGTFSLADIHNWVSACLPNVPDKVPDSDDDIAFYFRHVEWSTRLSCHYKRGVAVFKSDDASALFKIRGFMSDQATAKGVQLQVDAHAPLLVTSNLMRRLEPQFRNIVDRQKREELAKAIREAATDQTARDADDDCWMSEEFCAILESTPADGAVSGYKADDLLKDLYEFLLDLSASHRTFVNQNFDDEPFGKVEAQPNERSINELMDNLLHL